MHYYQTRMMQAGSKQRSRGNDIDHARDLARRARVGFKQEGNRYILERKYETIFETGSLTEIVKILTEMMEPLRPFR
jgi:hypothetical protein